jgi:transcriptional regulator with XRE-family HTH domain
VAPRKKSIEPAEAAAAPDCIGGKLKRLRGERGVTRGVIADRLGVDQTAISHTERRQNLMYSTLTAYIEALGGTLHVAATFPDSGPVILMGDASWRPAARKDSEPRK